MQPFTFSKLPVSFTTHQLCAQSKILMIPLEIYSHFSNKKILIHEMREKPKGKVIVVVVHKFSTVFHLFHERLSFFPFSCEFPRSSLLYLASCWYIYIFSSEVVAAGVMFIYYFKLQYFLYNFGFVNNGHHLFLYDSIKLWFVWRHFRFIMIIC